MNFGKLAETFLQKNFTAHQVKKYVGDFKEAYLTHSSNQELRKNAASGGVVSTLLIDSLNSGNAEGALVCKSEVVDGKVRARFFIAQTKEEILQAQGSTYVATKFSNEAIPLIRNFDGRVAVVGLPCDITMLKNKAERDNDLQKKIAFTIALACGHNSQKKLVDSITKKLQEENTSKLIKYRFRRGHWRGNLVANFENGKEISKPFSYFSIYQNLFFFAEKKCLFCHDHFGYDADLSIGDVWSYKLKNDPIKKSGIVAKTTTGSEVLHNTINNNILIAEPLEASEIVEGQKRAAPFHYNISARHLAGKRLGLTIPDTVKEDVKWHEFLSAYIVLFNWKWSQNKRYADWIFKIPKPIMKAYLYLLKGLESLK